MVSRFGAQIVAKVPHDWMSGLLPVLTDALEHGVPLTLLDGVAALRSTYERVAPLSDTDNRRKVLTAQRDQAEKEKSRAIHFALKSSKDDALMWKHAAEAAAARTRLVDRKLAELAAPVAHQLPPQFTAEVDYLLTAVQAIAGQSGRVDAATGDAVQVAFPRREITVTPAGTLLGTATVLLPIDGAVGMLGPLTWPLAQPILSYGLLFAANEAAGEPVPRYDQGWAAPLPSTTYFAGWQDARASGRTMRALMSDALRDAGYGRQAIATALDAPLPHIMHTLLAAALDQPNPSWTSDQWHDPRWREHLRDTYRTVTSRRYEPPAWQRQALLDLVVDNGGEIDVASALDALEPCGITYGALRAMTSIVMSSGRALQPVCQRAGFWTHRGVPSLAKSRELKMTATPCRQCGQIDATVVRSAETPGDAICSCGTLTHDPSRRPLTVPDEYHHLRVPRRVWQAQTSYRGAGRSSPGGAALKRARAVGERRNSEPHRR